LRTSWKAVKRRLACDMGRAATASEVKDLRRAARELKEVVAKQAKSLPAIIRVPRSHRSWTDLAGAHTAAPLGKAIRYVMHRFR
jgi:hypothetical protein